MKSYKPVIKYIGGIMFMMLLFVSCNDKSQNGVSPRYTEHTSPAKVTVKFPKSSKLSEMEFHIDNNKMRIFNKDYFPYKSQVDSVYLRMIVSTKATVKILNETTKKTIVYLPTDTGKIDLTGGRLRVSIEVEKEPTIVYDMRLLTYGYDPSQYTWEKVSSELPVAAINSKVIMHKGERYWISENKSSQLSLYKVTLNPLTFSKEDGAKLPLGFNPTSILVDKYDNAWGLDADGALYVSDNLKDWNNVQLGDVCLTMLLSDVSALSETSEISAVGFSKADENIYFTFTIGKNGIIKRDKEALSPIFPVRDAFVYTYEIGGIQHSYILGGVMKDGKPAPTSFFTSDGVRWGKTPYTGDKQDVPSKGGLFLRSPIDQGVFIIGGLYDGNPSNVIKSSMDRGTTWSELIKNQAPGSTFDARINSSGMILDKEKDIEFYIFGGITSGTPSTEIWHGWLDRSAGIINDF